MFPSTPLPSSSSSLAKTGNQNDAIVSELEGRFSRLQQACLYPIPSEWTQTPINKREVGQPEEEPLPLAEPPTSPEEAKSLDLKQTLSAMKTEMALFSPETALVNQETGSILFPRQLALTLPKEHSASATISALPVHFAVTGVEVLHSTDPTFPSRATVALKVEEFPILWFSDLTQKRSVEGEALVRPNLQSPFELSLILPTSSTTSIGESVTPSRTSPTSTSSTTSTTSTTRPTLGQIIAQETVNISKLIVEDQVCAEEDRPALENMVGLGALHRTRWYKLGSSTDPLSCRIRVTVSFGLLTQGETKTTPKTRAASIRGGGEETTREAPPAEEGPVKGPSDSRWETGATACRICYSDFSLLHRQHHCRHCGAAVCWACSPHFVDLDDSSGKLRTCTRCWQEIERTPHLLYQTIKQKIEWLSDRQHEPVEGTGQMLSYTDVEPNMGSVRIQQCGLYPYRLVLTNPNMRSHCVALATCWDLAVAHRLRSIVQAAQQAWIKEKAGLKDAEFAFFERVLAGHPLIPVARRAVGYLVREALQPDSKFIAGARMGYVYTRDTIIPTVGTFLVVPLIQATIAILKFGLIIAIFTGQIAVGMAIFCLGGFLTEGVFAATVYNAVWAPTAAFAGFSLLGGIIGVIVLFYLTGSLYDWWMGLDLLSWIL